MNEFQSWNRRTGQWVHFKDGKIHATDNEKFPGVPVRKGKPAAAAVKGEDVKAFNPPAEPTEKKGRSFHLADLWD